MNTNKALLALALGLALAATANKKEKAEAEPIARPDDNLSDVDPTELAA